MSRDEVLRALTSDLEAQGGLAITTDERPGPLGTTVLTARAQDGLYPGANTRVAVLHDERAYGAVPGPGLDAFLRDRGFPARAVDPATLVELHNLMALDGALVVADDPSPARLERPSGPDVIRLVTLDPMSGEESDHALVVPDDGPIELVSVAPDEATIVPLTREIGLRHALASRDAIAIARALTPFEPPLTAPERALLAEVAALPNDATAYEAVARLDPSTPSATALHEATTADPDARARVIALALAAHGEIFARAVDAAR